MIKARDTINVDALSDGPVPVMLSEELREFDLKDSDRARGRLQCKPPPPETSPDSILMCTLLLLCSPKCLGCAEPTFVQHSVLRGCFIVSCCFGPFRA